ncbi:MAG: alpha/beta fold hydrolase [Lentisphaeria bacterium]|nr:alpha/beta fold hydrolase [Lentisphaeria bacterium]
MSLDDGWLNGHLFIPDGPVTRLCLICPPLFEERKTAALPLTQLARALTAQGVAALRFDYRGTGDSSGDFAEYALTDWLTDTQTARHWLTTQFPGPPVIVFGLRFGAVPALNTRQTGDRLLLWEPVIAGEDYLLGELRKKLMKEMLTFGAARADRDALVAELTAGRTVDLDGYPLTARQFQEIAAVNLAADSAGLALAAADTFAIGPSGRASAPLAALAEALKACGPVTTHTYKMQAFWNQIGQIDCSELITGTVAALTKDPAPPSPAVRTAPALDGTQLTSPEASSEQPVRIASQGESLRGILHRPQTAPDSGVGVVFCHGWSGGRLGPHRMFVKTARQLADLGVTCLRLDFRGRGESDADGGTYGIDTMSEDARAGIDYLVSKVGVRTVVLLGICSGAKVAIAAAVADSRVAGLALWSAEGLGSIREASTNRKKTGNALKTYARKLLRPATWKKIITGKVDTASVRKAVLTHETRSAEEAARETTILKQFAGFKGPLLFVYGGNDPDTELAGRNYETFCRNNRRDVQSHVIPEANHSFYSLDWETAVITHTCDWLNTQFSNNKDMR